MFSNGIHLQGNYLRAMIIPLVIMIIANCWYNRISLRIIENVIKTYIIFSVALALYINITYFNSYNSWLSLHEYVFMDKNSAAQIWCTAVLLCFYLIKYENKRSGIIWWIIAIYIVIVCGLSQCRTAILGLLICLLVYVIGYQKKYKFIIVLFISIVISILLLNTKSREFIYQALRLNLYSTFDFNTITSDRGIAINRALEYIKQHPFIGTGKYYADCSYISILAESGLFGFLIIESIWVHRIYLNIRCSKEDRYNNFNVIVIMFTLFYIIESIFEGYPPFGPGVSSFMFWFLSEQHFSNNSNTNFQKSPEKPKKI